MANASVGSIRIIDQSGDPCDNDSGELKVKLASSDVTQPVSGTVTANLSAIDNAVLDTIYTKCSAIETTNNAIQAAVETIDDAIKTCGTSTYLEGFTSCAVSGGVRNDALEALADTNNEIAPLQVNASGALYVDTAKRIAGTVDTMTQISIDSSTTPILDALADRLAVIIVNDSDEAIYISLGSSAVMNRGIRLNAHGGSFSTEMYQGEINGICASGSKNVTVTEISP